MKKFVILKNNNKLDGVEHNDLGIVLSSNTSSSKVFFIRIWKEVLINNTDFECIDVLKTGDMYSKKICNVCHKLLDTDLFDKNQNGINNRTVRRPSCKNCRKLIDGLPLSNIDKKKWSKIKPNLEPFECPICKKRTVAGLTSKVVLDHNHLTGHARGWICDSCNTGIGRFKDDIEILKRAVDFLNKT